MPYEGTQTMPDTDALDGVFEWLNAAPDRRTIEYQIEKLRAIRVWALDHLGIDYTVGDKVTIDVDLKLTKSHGWWPYRECLARGATATVTEIDFNSYHRYWATGIMLDREWSVSDGGYGPFWHGPVADTPEGMDPPSPYDQEHYPAGRRHTFHMGAQQLRLAVPAHV